MSDSIRSPSPTPLVIGVDDLYLCRIPNGTPAHTLFWSNKHQDWRDISAELS
jgi:hypothetical protein